MSKHSKRSAPSSKAAQLTQSRRPTWLVPALLLLVAVAIISSTVWLLQRQGTSAAQPPAAVQTSSGDAATANGPRIAVDQEIFDYGDVKLNSTIETVVHVKNTGDRKLALDPNPVVELVEGC